MAQVRNRDRGLRPETSPALAPPPGNPRFPLMDACRGVAAMAIVVGHSYSGALHGVVYNLAAQTHVGVQVFFGLSGFLLFRPYLAAMAHERPPPRARDFFQRRALRILPAYWFALTVTALILGPPIVSGVFSSYWWLLYGLGQAYSLSHNTLGLAVAWTLSVELSFYVLLPLLAIIVRRMARHLGWRRAVATLVVTLIVIGTVVRALNQTLPASRLLTLIEHITYGLPGELPYFAVGIALAAASLHRELGGQLARPVEWLIARPWAAWALAGACFVFGATVGAYAPPVFGGLDMRARFPLNGLVDAAFVAFILLPAAFELRPRRASQRILAWRPLAFAGLVSYGLYLWHAPLADWLYGQTGFGQVRHWDFAPRWLVMTSAFIALGLIAGTFSYYLIELPFLKRKRGWRASRTSVASKAGTTLPEGDDPVVSRSPA